MGTTSLLLLELSPFLSCYRKNPAKIIHVCCKEQSANLILIMMLMNIECCIKAGAAFEKNNHYNFCKCYLSIQINIKSPKLIGRKETCSGK
jgi:hypothetical protein